MPGLEKHSGMEFVRLMMVGGSGAGKTGALTSLVKAGYKLNIIDMDNGLDSLINHIKAECPDKLSSVTFQTFRNKYRSTPAGIKVRAPAKALENAVSAVGKWEDGSNPAEWGPDSILVIDSLTQLGRTALEWAEGMNPSYKDPRKWYGEAQAALENFISFITSASFRTNVIVNTHMEFIEEGNGMVKAYPSALGKALSPKIPRYFNTLLLLDKQGTGTNVKRRIRTVPTGLLDAKNPAPMRVLAEYPIETGLAAIFEQLLDKPKAKGN